MKLTEFEYSTLSKNKYREHLKYPLHYVLMDINRIYPGFSSWYLDIMWSGIGKGYDVIVCQDNISGKILGVCVLSMCKKLRLILYM